MLTTTRSLRPQYSRRAALPLVLLTCLSTSRPVATAHSAFQAYPRQSEFAIRNRSATKMSATGTSEPWGKEGADVQASIQEIADDVWKVYTTRDIRVLVGVLDKRYSDKASFNDNIMYASGKDNVKLQFYSLMKIFDHVKIDAQKPEVRTSDPTKYVAVIDNVQTYDLNPTGWLSKKLLPKSISLPGVTMLEVDKATGLILRHEDTWKGKWKPPAFLRKANAANANFWLRRLGWEKALRKAAKENGDKVDYSPPAVK